LSEKADGKQTTSRMTEYERVVGRSRKLEQFPDERLAKAKEKYGLAKSELALAERSVKIALQTVTAAALELERLKRSMERR
jgi:hypothetical protein